MLSVNITDNYYINSTTMEDCWQRVQEMNFSVSLVLIQSLLLSVLNLLVVIGNGLVISAVLRYKRLRNVSGLMIASLASADLLVGLVVLPFSAINTILGVWIFNVAWCHVWLAFDVWMCTSSIYNLLVIALDRFIAVTRPLNYRSLVTRKRAFFVISGAWVISFIISFPPMIMTWPEAFAQPSLNCTCTPMGNSPAYIIFSSTGSFHLPFIAIFYLYYRIYLTVREATSSNSRGYVSVKGQSSQDAKNFDTGMSSQFSDSNPSISSITTLQPILKNPFVKQQSVTTENSNGTTSHLENIVLRVHRGKYNPDCHETTVPAKPRANSFDDQHQHGTKLQAIGRMKSLHIFAQSSLPVIVNNEARPGSGGVVTKRHKIVSFTSSTRGPATMPMPVTDSPKMVIKSKFRDQFSLNKKYQRKLEVEIKAMKTVGLVTFCFVICWLGFAIIYTLQAFSICDKGFECVPPLLFGIFFWLGYANSAINPLIYAACNRQYRQAFKELMLCKHFELTGSYSSNATSKTFERSGSYEQSNF